MVKPAYVRISLIKIYLALILALFSTNLCPAQGLDVTEAAKPPLRIVSLDMCADQYVLGLVARPQIAALSRSAMAPESYFRNRAKGIRLVNAEAEAILSLHPDLVIRTWGGDARLLAFLENNHIKTIQIQNLDSVFQARSELIRIGKALGSKQALGGEVIQLDQALKTLPSIGKSQRFLYYTPSGYSTGSGSFIGSVFSAMKFDLIVQTKGFYYIDPEHFIQIKTDIYGLGFFDLRTMEGRGAGRTMGVGAVLKQHKVINLPPQALSCADWTAVISLSDHRYGS